MRSYLNRPPQAYQLLPGFALLPEPGAPRLRAATPLLPLPSMEDVPPDHMIVDVEAALLCHSDRVQGENPADRGGATRGLERWLPEGGRVIMHEAALRFRWGGPGVQRRFPSLRDGDPGTTLVRWPSFLGLRPCDCPSCRRGRAKSCYYGFQRIVEFGIKDVPGAGQRRFIMPAEAFVPLERGLPAHWGALVEPTATFANGLREILAMARASYGPEWPATLDGRAPAALFFGLGPIALLGCLVARHLGLTPIGVSRTPLSRSARAQALVALGGHYFTLDQEPAGGWKDALPGHRVYVVAEGSGDGDSLSLLESTARDGSARWEPLTAFLFQSIPGAPKDLTLDAGSALTMHTLQSNMMRFFVNSDRDDYQLAQEALQAAPAAVVESFFSDLDHSFEALAERFWRIWDAADPGQIRTGVRFREPLPPVE